MSVRFDGTAGRTLTIVRMFYVEGKWEIEFAGFPLFDPAREIWKRYPAENFELVGR